MYILVDFTHKSAAAESCFIVVTDSSLESVMKMIHYIDHLEIERLTYMYLLNQINKKQTINRKFHIMFV